MCLFVCLGTFVVLTAVLGAFGVWFLIPQKITARCVATRAFTLASRGDVSLAPENTLPAIMGAYGSQKMDGAAIDLQVSSDNVPFIFQDSNGKRLAGVDKDVKSTTWDEIKEWSVPSSSELDGLHYNGTFRIPGYFDTIQGICGNFPSTSFIHMNLGKLSPADAETVWEAYTKSACLNRDNAITLFGTENPAAGNRLFRPLHRKSNKNTLAAFKYHPGSLPFGESFWLKTRFFQWYVGAELIHAHYRLYEAHPAVFQSFKDDGFCLGIYGGNKTTLAPFLDNVDVVQLDHPGTAVFPDSLAEYEPSEIAWAVTIAATVFLLVSWIAAVLWISVMFCYRS